MMPRDRNWWRNHLLAADVHTCLKRQENKQAIVILDNNTSYAYQRPCIIYALTTAADSFHLSAASKYLAVHLLDHYLSIMKFNSKNLQYLIASVALRLAIKIEEDFRLPKTKEFWCMYEEKKFTAQDFSCMERRMLQALHWNLLIPTVSMFLDYYKTLLVTELTTNESNKHCEAAFYHPEIIDNVLELALYVPGIYHTKPSMLATSVIVASRCLCDQLPLYPPSLSEVCQYPLQDILWCVEKLLSLTDGSAVSQRRVSSISMVPVAYDIKSNVQHTKVHKKTKGKNIKIIVTRSIPY